MKCVMRWIWYDCLRFYVYFELAKYKSYVWLICNYAM